MTNPLQHALAKIIGDAIFGHVHTDETPNTWGQSMSAAQDVLAAIVVNAAKAQTPSPAPQVTGGLWDQLTVLSGYYITQPPTPDHEFVQVCNGDLRKMVELMNTSVQAPAPQMTGRWRMFEEATGPGYWGIELEDAGNDDDAILYPIKAHRDTIARIVEAHNAALATSEGRSELVDKYDTGTTS